MFFTRSCRNSSDEELDKCLAIISLGQARLVLAAEGRPVVGGGVGAGGDFESAAPCSCELPHWPNRRGSCFRSAAQLGGRRGCGREKRRAETFGSVSVSVCIYAVSLHGSHRCSTPPPPSPSPPPPGQWSLANVYSTTLQRFALHFQTSNFILIKTSSTEKSPHRPNQNSLCRPRLV